jgi:predicted nucleic acid-binding protein
MRVLFDTNVILDLLLDRTPFADDAANLFARVEQAEMIGYLCATTLTTTHDLLTKALGRKDANTHIMTLMSMFEIAAVNRLVIEQAIEIDFTDFEDAVLYQAANHAGVNYLVTRNAGDFKKSTIPVYAPKEFISVLNSVK